jgi:AcrR family transcriptional regulator
MQDEEKNIDRRARRTRRQLKEALFALILEKGYDAVKIEDITERADLGRTTFYLHYHDKEELLLESIESIAEDLFARMPTPLIKAEENNDGGFVEDAILITFQHANENAQLYRVILRGEGASLVSGRLHRIISQIAGELLQKRVETGLLPASPHIPVDVFANYFAGALLALITWWLESGSTYPPEEMAAMFRKLFFQGGRKALTE